MVYTLKMLMIVSIVVGNLQPIYYTSPPKYVDVTMNVNIYPAGKVSYLQVYGPDSEEVSIGDCSYVGKRILRIPMRDDGSGTYIVIWHILSSDNLEEYEGATTFVVNEINVPFLLLSSILVACILGSVFLITRRFTRARRK
jgi:hypothetical protein